MVDVWERRLLGRDVLSSALTGANAGFMQNCFVVKCFVWRVCIVDFWEVFCMDTLPAKLPAAHWRCGELAVKKELR